MKDKNLLSNIRKGKDIPFGDNIIEKWKFHRYKSFFERYGY